MSKFKVGDRVQVNDSTTYDGCNGEVVYSDESEHCIKLDGIGLHTVHDDDMVLAGQSIPSIAIPKFEIGDIVTRISGHNSGLRATVLAVIANPHSGSFDVQYQINNHTTPNMAHESELTLVAKSGTYSPSGGRAQMQPPGSFTISLPQSTPGHVYYTKAFTSPLIDGQGLPITKHQNQNCQHSYKDYTGLYESYKYCTKCDIKKH
jgi:hypothetical protein